MQQSPHGFCFSAAVRISKCECEMTVFQLLLAAARCVLTSNDHLNFKCTHLPAEQTAVVAWPSNAQRGLGLSRLI